MSKRCCTTCKYKQDCLKQISCIDDYGQILNKKNIKFCSNFVPEDKHLVTFESKFSTYVALKNLAQTKILELARVLIDNTEVFILSVKDINLNKKDLIEILNIVFSSNEYQIVDQNQFEDIISQYLIIEKIKF